MNISQVTKWPQHDTGQKSYTNSTQKDDRATWKLVHINASGIFYRLISNVTDTIHHQKQEEKITQMNINRFAGLGFLGKGYNLDYRLKDSPPPFLENPTTEMVNRQIEISHYGRRTIDRRLPSGETNETTCSTWNREIPSSQNCCDRGKANSLFCIKIWWPLVSKFRRDSGEVSTNFSFSWCGLFVEAIWRISFNQSGNQKPTIIFQAHRWDLFVGQLKCYQTKVCQKNTPSQNQTLIRKKTV